jgi:DNA invertase Pin-like site-specific DNA recombinase
VALGWPRAAISVVDEDTGRSGASVDGRLGFQELVAEVGLGHVGLVLALETSRLARSSADWHQLLELCALTGTLIADQDGIYAPGQFNDRLLLGLKGTMSEAELHLIRARLDGGLRNKAARGELRLHLPSGSTATIRIGSCSRSMNRCARRSSMSSCCGGGWARRGRCSPSCAR